MSEFYIVLHSRCVARSSEMASYAAVLYLKHSDYLVIHYLAAPLELRVLHHKGYGCPAAPQELRVFSSATRATGVQQRHESYGCSTAPQELPVFRNVIRATRTQRHRSYGY